MPGVNSIHRLPGAVAVLADSWWRARQAVEALQVTWTESAAGTPRAVPADFSSEAHKEMLKSTPGDGIAFEQEGDTAGALADAVRVVEATYDASSSNSWVASDAAAKMPSGYAAPDPLRFNAEGRSHYRKGTILYPEPAPGNIPGFSARLTAYVGEGIAQEELKGLPYTFRGRLAALAILAV